MPPPASAPTSEIGRRTGRAGSRAARGVSPWSSFRYLRFSFCVVQKNTGRRLCFVFFGRESPPRAYPDRRLGWCDGVRRAAGLRSLRLHFGHSRLPPGGCRVAPKKKMGFLDLTTAGLLRFSFCLLFPSFHSSPDPLGVLRGRSVDSDFSLNLLEQQQRRALASLDFETHANQSES